MDLNAPDNRQVVLLKSELTLNRFYALAEPDSDWKNADVIRSFPDDVILGIAYPCLEDGLNDFATIRTVFETLDYYADDQDLRREMMSMVVEARAQVRARLSELRDRLASYQAHFLGTDLEEFKAYVVRLATQGTMRRQLDGIMKVDVYESVYQAEEAHGLPADQMYHYDFLPHNSLDEIGDLPGHEFVVRVFNDILEAVENGDNYENKFSFDRGVFQKFIALMFVNYATTDQIFYGTNKEDYGVSADKDMTDTPLYRAVGQALRAIERHLANLDGATPAEPARPPHDTVAGEEQRRTLDLPGIPMLEQKVLKPLNSICVAVTMLERMENARVSEYADVIRKAAEEVIQNLKQMGILSPVADTGRPRPLE